MTHLELDPIEVEDAPVLLQRALAPSSKLLLEIAIEPTDRASAWGYSQERLVTSPILWVLAPATNISVRP